MLGSPLKVLNLSQGLEFPEMREEQVGISHWHLLAPSMPLNSRNSTLLSSISLKGVVGEENDFPSQGLVELPVV